MSTTNIDTIQGHANYLINQWVNAYEYVLEALKLFINGEIISHIKHQETQVDVYCTSQ